MATPMTLNSANNYIQLLFESEAELKIVGLERLHQHGEYILARNS